MMDIFPDFSFFFCCVLGHAGVLIPQPGFEPRPSTVEAAAAVAAKLLQSCPTLCDPIDGGRPGSAVPGSLQAGTLECVAIFFSNA